MVRRKAVVFTAIAVVWVLASVGVMVYGLSSQFHSWYAIRIAVWAVQLLLVVAAVCFWLFERPRPMKVEGLPEPPGIHSS